MTNQIVITEKTSQANDVRAAVGPRYGAILPAEGHLFDLLEPEDVVPAWKQWTSVLLRPEGLYGTKPASGGNKAAKLRAIRDALGSAKRVWLATDCDREGQLIGQEILEHYDYRGVVMRVIFTAQDPQTIRDAFARARPNADYARLYAAAVARRQADQIYNLSLTRTATVTLARGTRSVIGVGRVKTPTLAIVCTRELEICNFISQAYFEVVAMAQVDGGQFRMRHAPKERIVKRDEAETIAAAAEEFEGQLVVRVEDKGQGPPRLHDLPSLQKLCGSRFGWSAARTLEVAQELYDGQGKKVITYPRAETRYLPESSISDVPRIIAGLRVGRAFSGIPLPETPIIRRGASGAFHDKGLAGASHHAVIPNVNTVDSLREIWPRLSNDERRLFDVIARSYLSAMMPDFRYRQTTVTLDVRGHPFGAAGRQPIEFGWRAAFPDWQPAGEKGDDAQLLPSLRNGDTARPRDALVEDKETRPPSRYNEGTLIEAMQNAWRFVTDQVLLERLKEAKGIGTPATRAEIIRGLALFAVLEQADPALIDPGVTAQMERLLDEVLIGQQEMVGAIDAVCAQASRIIGRLREGATTVGASLLGVARAEGWDRPPTSAMKRLVDRLAQRQGLQMPRGCTASSAACRAFLDQHAPKKDAVPATAKANAKQPAPTRRTYTRRLAPDRGSSVVPPAPIDVYQSQRPDEPNRKANGRKRKVGSAKTRTRRTAQAKEGALPTGMPGGDTPLRIPFGNKEAALHLGARYRADGWYAPPGVDLDGFRQRGWL